VFSGASFRVIIQLQYSVFWWLFLSYNSGSVLRFLVPPENTTLKLNNNSKTTTRTHNTEVEL
jgi:hypothetical protein